MSLKGTRSPTPRPDTFRREVYDALTRSKMTSAQVVKAMGLNDSKLAHRVSIVLAGFYDTGRVSREQISESGKKIRYAYSRLVVPPQERPPRLGSDTALSLRQALQAASAPAVLAPPPVARDPLHDALDVLLDAVAKRVARRLPPPPESVTKADLLALELRLYAAFGAPPAPPEQELVMVPPGPEGGTDKVAVKSTTTKKKPRIAVYRLQPSQRTMIANEFERSLDLTVFESGADQMSQAKQCGRGTFDEVILMTRFIGHGEEKLIQVGHHKPTRLKGALTELREHLQVLADEYQSRQVV